jgi:methionyl-tRNA formyltransferase
MSESTEKIPTVDAPTDAKPRIVFMGTPDFAVPSLEALVRSGFKPVAVVTGPDKPRGRGQRVTPTAVKKAALELGIEHILQPENVKDPLFAAQIEALHPDIMVVVAFRILPEAVFSAARLGTFNLHGSLLPRYRGAAPINRAIMAGDTETGVTTFLLQQKVDTGNVLLKRSMAIGENETAGEVHDRMMMLGAEVVVDTVRMLASGRYDAQAQDNMLATPAPKIFRDDCRIDWSQSVDVVHNQIRGLSPYPGAFTYLEGKQLKVFRCEVSTRENGHSIPGEILESGDTLTVACGKGALRLTTIQLEGKKAMSVTDFLRGSSLNPGTILRGG